VGATLRAGAVVAGPVLGLEVVPEVAVGAGFGVGGSTLRTGAVVVGLMAALVVGAVGFRAGGLLVARPVRRVVMVRNASV
jgi:hypothetical protein